MGKKIKVLFYGTDDNFGLCPSYLRAAKAHNLEYHLFDYKKEQRSILPFGKFGSKLHALLPVHLWNHRLNRKFVVFASQYKPDLIIPFTNAPISPASILFLKTVIPNCKFVLVWPDSLLNFTDNTMAGLRHYDFISTYGSTSVPHLQKLTAGNVFFNPLAGDPEIHGKKPSSESKIDIGFVGGWRPEREATMTQIFNEFPELSMEIHGPYWEKQTKKKPIAAKVKSGGLSGDGMADFFNRTKINVNIIDDTNFPSANMRFFEIPTAGGLQLVSECPEMADTFKHKEDLLYFTNNNELIEGIRWIVDNPNLIDGIKQSANKKINESHSYTLRLQRILEQVNK